ncbi:MAG: DUF3710 domain-containing protein [Actinomycetaceae bacterium]|nr:DUF3710 domain-containing protein [Actinomycetaceae bacterium]
MMGFFRGKARHCEERINVADDSHNTQETVGPYTDTHPHNEQRSFMSLGCIDIPYVEGMELVPAMDDQRRFHSVSVVIANLCVELALFAAPRSDGLWKRSFDTLTKDAKEKGFDTFSLTGHWGKELLIRPRKSDGNMPYRFVGIEGPGWLLRATYFGAAAESDKEREMLDAVVSHIVVHRGGDAKPPGELIYLTLPAALEEKVFEQITQ